MNIENLSLEEKITLCDIADKWLDNDIEIYVLTLINHYSLQSVEKERDRINDILTKRSNEILHLYITDNSFWKVLREIEIISQKINETPRT